MAACTLWERRASLLLDANSGEATALGAGFSVALNGTAFTSISPEFSAARVVDDADQNAA
jgi:hypothetical protein